MKKRQDLIILGISLSIIIGAASLFSYKNYNDKIAKKKCSDFYSLKADEFEYKISFALADLSIQIKKFYKHRYYFDDKYERIRIGKLYTSTFSNKIVNDAHENAMVADINGLCNLQVEFGSIFKDLTFFNSKYSGKSDEKIDQEFNTQYLDLKLREIICITKTFLDYSEELSNLINANLNNLRHVAKIPISKLKLEADKALKSFNSIVVDFFSGDTYMHFLSRDVEKYILAKVISESQCEIEKYSEQAEKSKSSSQILMFNYEWPCIYIINSLSDQTLFEKVKYEAEKLKLEQDIFDLKYEEPKRLLKKDKKKKNGWIRKPISWMKNVKSLFVKSKGKK